MATEFCPRCGLPRTGAFRFCRACQFDFDSAPLPVAVTSAVPGPVSPGAAPVAVSVAAAPATPIDWGALLVLVAGALAILGSFLPWLTATVALVGTVTRNGIDGGGDGLVTLILGLLVVLLGIALLAGSGSAKTARIGTILAAVVLAWIVYVDVGNVNERVAEITGDYATASVGMGLYVIGLAAILAVAGALLRGGPGTLALSLNRRSAVALAILVAVVAFLIYSYVATRAGVEDILRRVGESI
jgi:hypothetical protein